KKKMDYVNFYALNECPSRPPPGAPASEPWRTVLDSHIGTVITQEIKNNSFKVAKWTAQSILAGVDMMKIGFVSRALPRDRSNHYILNVQMQRPLTLAARSSLSLGGMWGIIRWLVNVVRKHVKRVAEEQGLDPETDKFKFVLLRDPNLNV
ncbi:unnamed protein product, partial [Symbiodinium sp. KB8]